MPRYKAYGRVSASKYLGEVEAKSEEEAVEKAFDLDACYVSVCHQCSEDVEDPEIHEINVSVVE